MSSVLNMLASWKLTLLVIAAIGAGVLVAYLSDVRTTWVLVVPLTLFAVNLAAVIATKPSFRRQTALLVFHLALIVIVLLIAIGRLTYLKGTLELAEGVLFTGKLATTEAGPLHSGNLKGVRFANDGFEIDYAQDPLLAEAGAKAATRNDASAPAASPPISDTRGVRRGPTRNRVRWFDETGGEHMAEIGDHQPLVIQGYRFYTSHNKGFAPVFIWMPDNGGPIKGAVHLPSYPANEYRQIREWSPSGSGIKLWTQLQIEEIILDPARPSQFRLPEKYKIVIRQGSERFELHPGGRVQLPGGVLQFDGLTTWMGYTAFYDWTISWLLAACIVAILSLAWFFWKKFAIRPWQ